MRARGVHPGSLGCGHCVISLRGAGAGALGRPRFRVRVAMSEPDQSEVKPGLRTVRYGARGSLVRVIREFGAASRWKGNLVATDMWRAPLESRPPTPPHGARASKSSKGAQRRPRLVYGRRTRLPQRMNELGVRSSFLSLAVARSLSIQRSSASVWPRRSAAPSLHRCVRSQFARRATERTERVYSAPECRHTWACHCSCGGFPTNAKLPL